MQIKPSHVILFDQEESESIAKLKNRKIDSVTGLKYNLKLLRCKDANLAAALKNEAQGSDSASLAKFLLGDESSWVTGQIIGVDGGRSQLS